MFVKSREPRVKSRSRREEQGATGENPSGLAFPLPPSPFRLRKALRLRAAISLTEVLISMGILTLGLLGVAALFPVGGFYMQKAEIADRGSAIAQSVMSELMTRGMLNPRAWFVMVPPNGSPAQPQFKTFPSDAKFVPTAPAVRYATYSRPFALSLSEALNQTTANTDPTLIGKQFGSAFVIDPMGVAAMAFPNPSQGDQTWNMASSAFPASAPEVYGAAFYSANAWQSWGNLWPIRRVTFRQPNTGWQMSPTIAEHYFRSGDDLVVDLPERDDRPARQNWDRFNLDNDGNNVLEPLARQWTGDYSWIVTVVPSTNADRDGMARNPAGHSYDVSVVVFYKRVLPDGAINVLNAATSGSPIGARDTFFDTMGANERAVSAKVISTGLNGGELLLTDLGDNPKQGPFEGLKAGQWIMLCGPHPNSRRSTDPVSSQPRFVMNWYQVISIEGEDRRLNDDGLETPAPPSGDPARRLVTARGPQWPWTPGGSSSDILCVAICRGAVVVHTKTMRLEDISGVTTPFGSSGNPKYDVPNYLR